MPPAASAIAATPSQILVSEPLAIGCSGTRVISVIVEKTSIGVRPDRADAQRARIEFRALMAQAAPGFKPELRYRCALRETAGNGAYLTPSRSIRLRSILRARRTAADFSRARFSDGFS